MVVPHTVWQAWPPFVIFYCSAVKELGHYRWGHAQVRGQPNWLARIHKHVHILNYINHNYCTLLMTMVIDVSPYTPSFYLLAIETFKNWWIIGLYPRIILAQIAALIFAYKVYNKENRYDNLKPDWWMRKKSIVFFTFNGRQLYKKSLPTNRCWARKNSTLNFKYLLLEVGANILKLYL